MLTPAFDLHQDDRFLYINIKAPFAKISDTEIHIEDCDFKFFSKPYFLRLTLPGAIVEDGQETAKYDTDSNEFRVRVAKATPGEAFSGLDMLTRLLAPSGGGRGQTEAPGIEVIGAEGAEAADDDADDFDWQVEQTPHHEEEAPDTLLAAPTYGFAGRRSGVLARIQEDVLAGILDLRDADTTPASERAQRRIEAENHKFDPEHYLADLYDDDVIMSLIMYKPPWAGEFSQRSAKSGEAADSDECDSEWELTESERATLRQLPRGREFVLSPAARSDALLGLVDVLFGFAYDHRTTEGEPSVESPWTIAKLAATLSWLQPFASVSAVCRSCFRRSLCYPLYRHHQLAAKVWADVHRILACGRRRVLKCLLAIRSLFLTSDGHYVLNDLYITDYCVWIQTVSEKCLASLADSVSKVKLTKADLDLDLDSLEKWAAEQKSSPGVSPLAACPQHSPGRGDVSFPNADLDLASSTDSGSDDDDDDDDETDDSSSEEESEDAEPAESNAAEKNMPDGSIAGKNALDGSATEKKIILEESAVENSTLHESLAEKLTLEESAVGKNTVDGSAVEQDKVAIVSTLTNNNTGNVDEPTCKCEEAKIQEVDDSDSAAGVSAGVSAGVLEQELEGLSLRDTAGPRVDAKTLNF